MWSANNFMQDLNSSQHVHFLQAPWLIYIYNKTVCLWMIIYILPPLTIDWALMGNLLAATYAEMQHFSYELNTPIAERERVCVKKIYLKKILHLYWDWQWLLGKILTYSQQGFNLRLKHFAGRATLKSFELWYDETISEYIYIYICIKLMYLHNPSTIDRMLHKANFKVKWIDFRVYFLLNQLLFCFSQLRARKKAWKKRKKVEQVYWINRTYIQNKCVSTAGRSEHLKLSGLTAGRKSLWELNREGGRVHYHVGRSP